jgi:hypothetical protein
MTDMQKRLSDLQRDVNQLKNEKFRPRKFDNAPRFNYGRGQAYEQNYGRGPVLLAAVVRQYERPSVILRSALLKVSNSTANRIASFKIWGRDCLMRILISESARASIKCCFASAWTSPGHTRRFAYR